jgi:hypothetical protein
VNTCDITAYTIEHGEDCWIGCDITPETVTYPTIEYAPHFWIGSLDESDDERHPPQFCEDVSVIDETDEESED